MENREKIGKVALDLFAEKGYASVGVQEIVDKSGISKPTLYHYFGNKEGLYRSLLDEGFSTLFSSLDELFESEEDIFPILQKILRFFLVRAERRENFFRIYLSIYTSPLLSEENRFGGPLLKRVDRKLEDFFIQASHRHGNMQGRHRDYSAAYLGLINSCITRLLNGEIEITDDFIYRTVHYFAHGIYS